jgi:hypothetical protein
VPLALLDWQDSATPSSARAMLNRLFRAEFGDDCAHMAIGVHKSSAAGPSEACVIAVVLGHVVADLISAAVLLKELVYFLSVATKLTSQGDAARLLPRQASLPLSALQIVPPKQRGCCKFLCCGGVGAIKGLVGKASVNRAVQLDVRTPAERQQNDGFVEPAGMRFTEAETSRLVAACKQHGVSVHSALGIALHYAHRFYLTQNPTRNAKVSGVARHNCVTVPLLTTVDLRRRASPPVPADVVGSLAYSVTTETTLDLTRTSPEVMREDFWAATADLYAQLNQAGAAQTALVDRLRV